MAKLKKYSPLIILLAIMAIAFSQGWHSYFTIEEIAKNRDLLKGFVNDNYLLALLAYALVYILAVAISLPGATFITITGGLLFSWYVAVPLTVTSATIGASILFLIAKSSFGDSLAKKSGPMIAKLADGFKKDAFNYLLFLRLVPVFPFWIVNLAPAILGVSLTSFFIGTFIGIIPGSFAITFIGTGFDSIIVEQQQLFDMCVLDAKMAGLDIEKTCEFNIEIGALLTDEIIIALCLLGLVALMPIVIKRFKERKNA